METGGTSNTATKTINIGTPVNDPPTAGAKTGNEDKAIAFTDFTTLSAT